MAKLSDLTPDDKNANKGTVRGRAQLEQSMRKFGFLEPGVLDKNDNIVGGNKRTEVAADLGLDDPIIVETDGTRPVYVRRSDLDLTTKRGREAAIALNRTAQTGIEFDGSVLEDLIGAGVEVGDWFFENELEALLGAVGEVESGLLEDADPDAIPAEVETRCKPGDLWQLGRHRLLCGDSTNPQHIESLFEGKRASLVFSDPPYGYEYQSNMRTKSPKFEVLTNDDCILSDYLPLLPMCSDGWVIVCTSWKVIREWMDACEPLGKLQNVIIWDKGGGGMGDLSHSLLTDYEMLLAYNRGAEIIGKRIGTVWSIGKDAAGSYQHATQKPVELFTTAYETFTRLNDLVFDPFAGSGSGIVAAESCKRTAYAIELEPSNVDVILTRWERATGKTAELMNGTTHEI